MKIRMLSMVMLLFLSICLSNNKVNASTSDVQYELTMIQEEEVALAPTFQESHLFPYAVAGIVFIIGAIAATVYILECKKYRLRIRELILELQQKYVSTKSTGTLGWNLLNLKRETKDLEEKVVTYIMNE